MYVDLQNSGVGDAVGDVDGERVGVRDGEAVGGDGAVILVGLVLGLVDGDELELREGDVVGPFVGFCGLHIIAHTT